MIHRPSLAAGIAIGAIASACAIGYARPGVARQPPAATVDQAPTAEVGRYRIAANQSGVVFVIDSVTGQCWRRDGSGASRWLELGSPVGDPD